MKFIHDSSTSDSHSSSSSCTIRTGREISSYIILSSLSQQSMKRSPSPSIYFAKVRSISMLGVPVCASGAERSAVHHIERQGDFFVLCSDFALPEVSQESQSSMISVLFACANMQRICFNVHTARIFLSQRQAIDITLEWLGQVAQMLGRGSHAISVKSFANHGVAAGFVALFKKAKLTPLLEKAARMVQCKRKQRASGGSSQNIDESALLRECEAAARRAMPANVFIDLAFAAPRDLQFFVHMCTEKGIVATKAGPPQEKAVVLCSTAVQPIVIRRGLWVKSRPEEIVKAPAESASAIQAAKLDIPEINSYASHTLSKVAAGEESSSSPARPTVPATTSDIESAVHSKTPIFNAPVAAKEPCTAKETERLASVPKKSSKKGGKSKNEKRSTKRAATPKNVTHRSKASKLYSRTPKTPQLASSGPVLPDGTPIAVSACTVSAKARSLVLPAPEPAPETPSILCKGKKKNEVENGESEEIARKPQKITKNLAKKGKRGIITAKARKSPPRTFALRSAQGKAGEEHGALMESQQNEKLSKKCKSAEKAIDMQAKDPETGEECTPASSELKDSPLCQNQQEEAPVNEQPPPVGSVEVQSEKYEPEESNQASSQEPIPSSTPTVSRTPQFENEKSSPMPPTEAETEIITKPAPPSIPNTQLEDLFHYEHTKRLEVLAAEHHALTHTLFTKSALIIRAQVRTDWLYDLRALFRDFCAKRADILKYSGKKRQVEVKGTPKKAITDNAPPDANKTPILANTAVQPTTNALLPAGPEPKRSSQVTFDPAVVSVSQSVCMNESIEIVSDAVIVPGRKKARKLHKSELKETEKPAVVPPAPLSAIPATPPKIAQTDEDRSLKKRIKPYLRNLTSYMRLFNETVESMWNELASVQCA